MYGYSLFGLRVLATRRLPGLPPSPSARGTDVRIDLGALPPGLDEHAPGPDTPVYVSPDRDDAGHPVLTVSRLAGGESFRLRYADGIEFVLDRAGTTIWANWPDPWTLDDVATYLLGSVMAFVLRLRGVTCLHASAVAVDGEAVALVGPAGAGKSTLAAALANRGHAVIADDVVALSHRDGRFFLQPGTPRIRLWPESVAALYGSPDALPRLTPTWDKRFLDVTQHGHRFERQPLPLAAIYCLAERRVDPATPHVEPLSPAASFVTLIANTHANHLLDDAMRAQEFECLGLVVASVPIRWLIPHEDPALLSTLCDVVLDDARAARFATAAESEAARHV